MKPFKSLLEVTPRTTALRRTRLITAFTHISTHYVWQLNTVTTLKHKSPGGPKIVESEHYMASPVITYAISKKSHMPSEVKLRMIEWLTEEDFTYHSTQKYVLWEMFSPAGTEEQNTHTQTFHGSMDFVRDNPGEPVPEETFIHSHLSCSSIFPYLLHPSTMIHSILPVQSTYLTIIFHNLSPSYLWSTSWPSTLHFILHTFLHPIIVFFSQHKPIPLQPVSL